MARTSQPLPKDVWDKTVDAVAAQASRSANVSGKVKYVYAYRIFGVEHYWLESDYPTLLDSLMVVSQRFR
jgi:hypothetical protein